MDFLIPSIILFISLTVMIYIMARRVPELKWIKVQPAKEASENIRRSFFREILLQKILSKTRVATLKTESTIAGWLTSLRQKSADQKSKFSDDYWKTIKGGK